MAAGLPKPSLNENVSTTLATGISDVASSMDVADASAIASPCYLVIDRVDSSGALKNTSFWEYVKVTNVSSNTLSITRGQSGSTQQSHSSGAIVEAVVTSAMFEDWYAALNPEHTAAGGHVIATATIVDAVIITSMGASGASVTIGSLTVPTFLNASGASVTINSLSIPTYFNIASASVVGMGLNPTWYIPSLPSLASTGLGRPMTMPRAGTWNFVNVTLNANISSPSIFFDINKNFTSIFDTVGRPLIAGGTFVSTASIKTTTFNQGDVFSVDLDFGGNNVDATVTLAGK